MHSVTRTLVHKGVYTLPIKIPETPLSQAAIHYMYVKKGTIRTTLYLMNIPFDSTLEHFQQVFGSLGSSHVVAATANGEPIDQNPRKLWPSGSNAEITFENEDTSLLVFENVKNGDVIPVWDSTDDPPLGKRRYEDVYNRSHPPDEQILKEAEKYITKFEKSEAAQKRERTRLRTQPDDSGFMTVTRGGRTGVAKVKGDEKKKRKNPSEYNDFYSFQMREERKKHMHDTLQKFEEDKKKIAALKQKRRFKPY